MLDKYAPAAPYFHDRLREGATVFRDISAVLGEALEQYVSEDESRRDEIKRLENEL
ncbi:hypothetical protein [Nocardia puris]|uniref:Uncharacterized protein n=1 Tax=Nocardia puris TaxID=208602 RepID=A0A366DNT0_9NOCA|nr:hypothetical protein [Nocardia puris]RBO91575.1 hypothetical protein DFR74_104278 [Nocardia puris]